MATCHSPLSNRPSDSTSAISDPKKLWKPEFLSTHLAQIRVATQRGPKDIRPYGLVFPDETLPTRPCRSVKVIEYRHLPGPTARVSNTQHVHHIIFLKFKSFLILKHICPLKKKKKKDRVSVAYLSPTELLRGDKN